jgi:hypothetical protein
MGPRMWANKGQCMCLRPETRFQMVAWLEHGSVEGRGQELGRWKWVRAATLADLRRQVPVSARGAHSSRRLPHRLRRRTDAGWGSTNWQQRTRVGLPGIAVRQGSTDPFRRKLRSLRDLSRSSRSSNIRPPGRRTGLGNDGRRRTWRRACTAS